MRELEGIERKIEVATLTLGERVARIYDALHALHDLTLTTFSTTPRDPERVDGWIEGAGFGLDAHGYFERLALLERARAGESDPDAQTYYANRAISEDPEARFRMYAMRELPRVVRGIKERLPGLAWVYYQDGTGFAMTYPMHDPCTVVPADFDWHGYYTYASVGPDVNPERAIRWTAPNIDYGGKGLMVSASIPLYRGDALVGVWSFDVPVAGLVDESLITAAPEESVFIVDREGHLVAHDTIETLVSPEGGSVSRAHLRSLGGGLGGLDVPALLDRERGTVELVDADGRASFAVHRTVARLDWLLVVTVPTEDVVARTRALFDASPMGIALVDRRGEILEVNAELARIVGVAPKALVEGTLAERVDEELRARLAELLADTAADGAAGPVEGTVGEGTPVRVVTRRFVSDGAPCALFAFEDITERRRLQAQLLQTQKMQAIGRLAGGIAHDFNNLLTAILGSSTLLRMRAPDPYHELIDSITYAAERAAALTGQLLAFSRRQVVQPRRIDLPELVGGLEELLGRLVDDDVELVFEVGDDVPPVRADPGQLEQIVMNLVLNARDALADGGRVDVKIHRCVLGSGEDGACLSVADDGVGMDDETRARLFEPFFTTKRSGTGLGLATVDDIVRSCGGAIEVESRPGAGTRVHIQLPSAARDSKAADAPPAPIVGEVEGLILVVDDEPLVRETARRLLEEEGFEVAAAASGEEALELLAEGRDRVALVLSDVVMPGLGGRELLERVVSEHAGLPVLLMTGYTDDQILRQGIEASDVPLLRKPFSPAALLRAVTDALSR